MLKRVFVLPGLPGISGDTAQMYHDSSIRCFPSACCSVIFKSHIAALCEQTWWLQSEARAVPSRAISRRIIHVLD